jgi:hypothetical protein
VALRKDLAFFFIGFFFSRIETGFPEAFDLEDFSCLLSEKGSTIKTCLRRTVDSISNLEFVEINVN